MQISIWEQESFFAARDVIIIGAGLNGLWCALELKLKNPLRSILILEKGLIPAGASTRNAGFACFGSPTELIHDAAFMGEERMWHIAEMRYKGIEKIKLHFGDNVIDYDNSGGFECLLQSKHDIAAIDEQLPWLNKGLKEITGIGNTFSWANDKLQAFGLSGFDAMIENRLEGGLHSGKLVQALTKKVQNKGVEVITSVHIESWEENSRQVVVCTKEGIRFSAARLIVCSNAFSSQLLPQANVTPGRGQIFVTSPVNNLKLHGTFHFDEGFYYFRNVGDRILLGGARNKAFEEETSITFETTDVIQQELQRFMAVHLLPSQPYTIDYRWSGIMGFTDDKQPSVKQISERITAIIACNGMGVALSPVIAEQIQL